MMIAYTTVEFHTESSSIKDVLYTLAVRLKDRARALESGQLLEVIAVNIFGYALMNVANTTMLTNTATSVSAIFASTALPDTRVFQYMAWMSTNYADCLARYDDITNQVLPTVGELSGQMSTGGEVVIKIWG